MNEIMLVNPRRRRRSTKRRTTTRKRRRNPVANPRRRRRSVARKRSYRRRRNPTRRLTARNIQNTVMGAIPGAFGALALDVSLGYIPLPPAFTATPILGYVTKGVAAILLGSVANATKLVSAKVANDMTQGALTVMIHGALKTSMAQFAPNIPMGEYLDYNNGMAGLGYAGSGWNPNVEIDDPTALGTYLPSLSDERMTTDQYGLSEYLNDELPGGSF